MFIVRNLYEFHVLGILIFLVVCYLPSTLFANPLSVYDTIQEKKIIRVGVSFDYPPLNANQDGVEMKMVKQISNFLEVKVQLVPYPLTKLIDALKKKQLDMIVAGLSCNIERAKHIWFSKPYIETKTALLVSNKVLSKIQYNDRFEDLKEILFSNSLKNLLHYKILVKKDSIYMNRYPLKSQIYVTNQEGLYRLKTGDAVGILHDLLFLEHTIRQDVSWRKSFRLIINHDDVHKLCIGLPFGAIILKNQIDFWIDDALVSKKNLFPTSSF